MNPVDEVLKALQKVERLILSATVPIWAIQNDTPKQDRSGVLYEIAGERFILTASHCDDGDIRDAIRQKIPLFIPTREPIHLCNSRYYGTEVEPDEDARDILAIKLDPEAGEKLASQATFVRTDSIQGADDGNGLYCVVGYPIQLQGKPLRLVLTHEQPITPNSLHLILDLNPAEQPGPNDMELPSLTGMSGCGIWRIADLNDAGVVWYGRPLLVGIQHRVRNKSAPGRPNGNKPARLRGTRIDFVCRRILDDCPSLQVPMSLWYRKAATN